MGVSSVFEELCPWLGCWCSRPQASRVCLYRFGFGIWDPTHCIILTLDSGSRFITSFRLWTPTHRSSYRFDFEIQVIVPTFTSRYVYICNSLYRLDYWFERLTLGDGYSRTRSFFQNIRHKDKLLVFEYSCSHVIVRLSVTRNNIYITTTTTNSKQQ